MTIHCDLCDAHPLSTHVVLFGAIPVTRTLVQLDVCLPCARRLATYEISSTLRTHPEWLARPPSAPRTRRHPVNPTCPTCGNQDTVVKHGRRINKYSVHQRYQCGACGHKFQVDNAKNKLPEAMYRFMQEAPGSAREVAALAKAKFQIPVSHVTVIRYWKRAGRVANLRNQYVTRRPA